MKQHELAVALTEPLRPKKGTLPKGTVCKSCGSDNLSRTIIPVGGPFSGHVSCNACGYSQTVMTHIAENIVSVEPLASNTNRLKRRV